MKYLINASGEELPNDMACSSTIEPYAIEDADEDLFYGNMYPASVMQRAQAIVEYVIKHSELLRGIIIENNELGRHIFKETRGKNIEVVKSVKRLNSKLHWYWELVDNFPEPATELQTITKSDVVSLSNVLTNVL